MHYVINVALNGQHFFATAEHSLRDEDAALKAVADFKLRFPKEEGFTIDLTCWESVGKRIDISGVEALPKGSKVFDPTALPKGSKVFDSTACRTAAYASQTDR